MRIAIAALLLCSVAFGGEPNPEAERLKQLAERMAQLEGMLRQDRHDASVQVEGKLIESSMGAMIEKMEKQEQQQQQQDKQKQQAQKQQKQEKERQQGSKPSQSPLANSMPKAPVPPGEVNPPAAVTGQQSKWAKLPKAQRDELLQAYGEDLPMRWRKRLEAYFYSIATEEEKDNHDRK